MNYSAFYRRSQKIASTIILAFFLFQNIFSFPAFFFAQSLAIPTHEDLVSILVEKELFDLASEEIQAYASRIQAQLPDTRSIIFPLEADVDPVVIATLNERLYRE